MTVVATAPVGAVFIGPGVPGATRASVVTPPDPMDMEDGGDGRIVGTVKEKSSPLNTPLRRRVILQNSRDKRTVRETWSDATSGAYEFAHIASDRSYDVISYDHTGLYRGVVADNLSPELMT